MKRTGNQHAERGEEPRFALPPSYMHGLYPIIRRVRRPLIAPELPLPEVKAAMGNIEHPTSNPELRTGEPAEAGTPNLNDEPIIASAVE